MVNAVEAPKEVYNKYIYFCSMVACFAVIVIGYDTGFIGGMVQLPAFNTEFLYDTTAASKATADKANIISLFHAGAFFGSYAVYPLGIYLGRVLSMKIVGFFILIGSAIELISNGDRGIGALLAGRVISGFGVGGVSNLAPMYISEISPPKIRGRLLGMYEVGWQIGGIIGFFINYGTVKHITGPPQWLIPVAVQCIPAGIFIVGVFFITESPRWHFTRGDKETALKTLCKLRHLDPDHDYITYEIAAMEAEAIARSHHIKNEVVDPFKLLFGNRNLRNRIIRTALLFMFQNATGINAINYYSVSLFKTIGIQGTSATLLSTGIFGILKGVCCFLWAFLIIDRYGRKIPLMIGSIVVVFCLFYVGAYIKIARPEETLNGKSDSGSKSALAFFYIWTLGYAFSWSGLPWVYMSEVFDSKVRNLAQCFNASGNWFWAFILARFAQQMIDAMQYGIFFFFGALTLVFTTIYMVGYPDTSKIPITDVDLLFEKGVMPWRAHSRALRIIHEREQANVVGSSDLFDKPSENYIEIVSDKKSEDPDQDSYGTKDV